MTLPLAFSFDRVPQRLGAFELGRQLDARNAAGRTIAATGRSELASFGVGGDREQLDRSLPPRRASCGSRLRSSNHERMDRFRN